MSLSDEFASHNLIGWAIAAIAAVIVVSSSVAVVPETKQVLVVRFGKPEKVYNAVKVTYDFGRE